MKFLRWVLVIVLSWLIVWGLWSLAQDNQLASSQVFSPLRNQLVSSDIINTSWSVLQPQNISPTNNNSSDVIARISKELIPELSYGSMPTNTYSSLLNDWQVLGNQNADYLMIQYCDYSMTYCEQAQRQWALIAYQDALSSNLWYMLKPFLLETNPTSEMQHHALQCAQKTWTDSQINRMHALLFDLDDRNTIREAGSQLRIEWFESCFMNTSSLTSLTSQRSLARRTFEVRQLPSFILIDTRSLERTLIPGLYEEELVVAYLKQL
jgi:hypothetical protein